MECVAFWRIYDWPPIDLSTATARSIADRPNDNSTIRSSPNAISPNKIRLTNLT